MGQKELVVEYDKRLGQIHSATLATPSNRFATVCPLRDSSRGVIIDIGDGDEVLFDVRRQIMYHNMGSPTSFAVTVDDFRPRSVDDLEHLLSNLVD